MKKHGKGAKGENLSKRKQEAWPAKLYKSLTRTNIVERG